MPCVHSLLQAVAEFDNTTQILKNPTEKLGFFI